MSSPTLSEIPAKGKDALGTEGVYCICPASAKNEDRALRQFALVALVTAVKEEIPPAGVSVGNTNGRAGDAFRRPVRLP